MNLLRTNLIYFIMKSILIKFIIIIFFILLLLNKDIIYITIYKTTLIWFKQIVPNLFPMFIISSLIVNSNLIFNLCNLIGKPFSYIFKVSKYGAFVYILSLITGSPSNAKYLKDLKETNLISIEEINKLLTFTTNYNPLLILSLLSLYLPKNVSYKILIIIILSNIIVGLLFRNIKVETCLERQYNVNKKNISIIIKETMDTLFMILGTLIFFNLIINLLPINNLIFKNIFNSLLEITTGLNGLQYININLNFKIILSIIYLSFGGLSIHTQIKSILPDTNYALFLKSRLYCLIVSLSLTIFVI